jgi:glutamyl-tRNA reductase
MDEIILLGLNHKTAPVELRECLAFSEAETDSLLCSFSDHPVIKESLIISTCNRVEILLTTPEADEAILAAKRFLSEYKGVPISLFQESLYLHRGDAAVRHLFRVAASLDSMVVGEPQILGQIKEAYRTATRRRTSGVILNRLLHKTFFAAKRVRSETGIGDHAVSISYAAIELGRKIFGSLEGMRVMLIGAGEMAELAVEHLIRHRAGEIYVANRTFARGMELARRFRGTAIRFDEIGGMLTEVDIIISSTGSPEYVIDRKGVKAIMRGRKHRPLFFIDIAVPRDIDPSINRLDNAYVYDIDDLKGVIDENIEDRNREAVKAERIIDAAVVSFRKWYRSLDVVPTIKALRNKMSAIARTEIEKTLGSLHHLSETDAEALHRMTEALINKMMHDPTIFLKTNGCQRDKAYYVDITRKLFNLDAADPGEYQHSTEEEM